MCSFRSKPPQQNLPLSLLLKDKITAFTFFLNTNDVFSLEIDSTMSTSFPKKAADLNLIIRTKVTLFLLKCSYAMKREKNVFQFLKKKPIELSEQALLPLKSFLTSSNMFRIKLIGIITSPFVYVSL